MISAFISSIDGLEIEDNVSSVRGNGKTISMVYCLYEDYLEGRFIFTNFKCSFSKMLPAKQIIEEITLNQEIYLKKGVSVGLTEIQTVINSLGTSHEVIKFSSFFAAQTRKRNCDVMYDLQILMELNNRFRNQTDNIFRPEKIHANGSPCYIDRCELEHWVKIYGIKPYTDYNILGDEVINCQETGKLYDTNEIVFDEIIIEKKGKRKRKINVL